MVDPSFLERIIFVRWLGWQRILFKTLKIETCFIDYPLMSSMATKFWKNFIEDLMKLH